MATEINILFTGICLFLTKKNRVIIGTTPGTGNCHKSTNIPAHMPYLTYRQDQKISGKSQIYRYNGREEAVSISGLINISGNFAESMVTYPNSAPKLPNVVVANAVAPLYTPLPSVTEDDPTQVDRAIVAARIDIPYGDFQMPICTDSLWHFFPSKGTSVLMPIAQAVVLKLHANDDQIKITEQPLGTASSPSEVVTVKAANGERILIVIGNSSDPDIAPTSPRPRSYVGPDFDFELHWNSFDRQGDVDCPPASYNEGPPISANGNYFLTLGGGNCPPLQWE
jgi:hypothetical protein